MRRCCWTSSRAIATLFIRFDEVEWAWRVVDPMLKVWAQERDFIHTYPAGSLGPARPTACSSARTSPGATRRS